MISKARLSAVLGGGALVAGGALLAASPGAMADTLPTPEPPTLISATVTGCPQGFCEPGQTGELVVNYKAAPLPAGAPSDAQMGTEFFANGKFINGYANVYGPGISFMLCDGNVLRYPCLPAYGGLTLGNNPVITAKAGISTGNPDDNNVQTSPLSGPSNSVTVNLGG